MRDNFELSTVDKLFLELSQFTTATTAKEIKLETALRHIQKLNKDIKVDTVDLRKAIEESEELTK